MNRSLYTFLIVWGAMMVGGGSVHSAANLTVHELIPGNADIQGWKVVEGPDFYRPQNLFELVNGAAPFYLNYGFNELSHARYCPDGKSAVGITVDLYDMGSVEGGFGVYSSVRHPDETFEKLGTQGYISGTLLVAWKQQFYLSIEGENEDPRLLHTMKSIAHFIMDRVPGGDAYPDLFHLLPPKNRLSHTEQYISQDYLGYRFLDQAMSAQYRISSSTVTLFVSLNQDQAQASSVLNQLAQSFEQVQDLRLPTHVHAFTDKYLGKILLLTRSKYVIGVFSDVKEVEWTQWIPLIESVLENKMLKQKHGP